MNVGFSDEKVFIIDTKDVNLRLSVKTTVGWKSNSRQSFITKSMLQ
jgi:hypothetical protein